MSDDIRDDISYMRTLAESGHKGRILGGVFLALAGAIFGAASAVSWAARQGYLPIAGWNELYLWLGAFGVFALCWVVLFLRLRSGTKAVPSASNATFGTIWSACGAGVMVAFGTTELIAHNLNAPIILNGYVPVIYAFYGAAWMASAALAKRAWMYLAGFGSFGFAFVIAVLAENSLQTPAMAAGLVLLLTLPGLKLMAEEAR